MADSSEVDAALVAKLLADSALMAAMPDGIYFDQAKQNATRYVIVSLVAGRDEPMFQKRAYEERTYLVKAVAKSTTGADVRTAAARIDALLDYGTLAITGYSLMSMRRVEPVRYSEPDDVDLSIKWQHRGGRYTVMVSPS